MTLRRTATVLGLLALALPAVVAAQGLGDAAARERTKRDAAKKAEAKVFTNEDLDQGRPPGTPAASGDGSPSAPPPSTEPPSSEGPEAGSAEPSPEAERRTEEQRYVDGLQAAQTRLAQIEARIQELQDKLNPMSTTFIYGDYNSFGTDKVKEEAEVRAALTQSQTDLDGARQAVAAATRALQDFKQGRLSAPPVE